MVTFVLLHKNFSPVPGASLVERMSGLLDKHDTQNESLKMKILGFVQALLKCVMKIREKVTAA